MIAFLSCDGKTPDDSERLTILVKMGTNACLLNSTIQVGIGSRLQVLDFILPKSLSMSCSESRPNLVGDVEFLGVGRQAEILALCILQHS